MAITGLEMVDLVREVCHDGGAGPLLLGGAVLGYRGFAASVGAGAAFPYAILSVVHPAEWECGVGGLDVEGRLARTPTASSAGGAAVDFAVGEKLVVLTPHADWLAAVEAHGHGIGEIGGLAAALAGKQAASGELDAIAALATSGFGRGALVQADAAAMRAYIGAGTSSTVGTVTQVAGSGGTTGLTVNGGPVTGAGTLTLGGTLAIEHGGTGAVSAAGARTALGLGSAATQAVGTSGASVPLLNGANSFSATTTFSSNCVSTRVGQAIEVGHYLRADAGYNCRHYYQTGTSTRWDVGKTAAAESGSDAGSNFTFNRYGDSGAYISTVLTLSRSSGLATFGHGVALSSTSAALTVGNGASATLGSVAPLAWVSARANSQSNANTTPQESLRLSWQEGSQDLGVGEGNAINFSASLAGDGTVFYPVCQIASYKEASADSDRRSSLIFSTSDDGTVAVSEKMRITAATGVMVNAVLQPLTDNVRTLGSAASRWSVIYAATGTINTSDARAKCDVAAVDDALLDAWGDVQWVTYRWRDAVAAKGDEARVHVGLMAQGVRDAIDARLGAGAAVRLGLLCCDDLPDGAVRWGLRYDQCFALEAAWQRRRLDRIEARIDALLAGDGHDAG
ncbi:hypothetical protein D0Z70_05180 [Sphingobium terrigena]|uniref:Peptidase S74 domain-containing protein n=1 Tax=Sphingobium terrigena TaxID=2304063 RepID=A0A418YWG1_9SPHN|nr:tail fiber domain-containing protein [Sphingobium terrigena]RJG56731.1 hypothetical protein D0Z70_05180 [Sphingobium terrigena]